MKRKRERERERERESIMYENVDDYYFCKKIRGKGGWKVSRG